MNLHTLIKGLDIINRSKNEIADITVEGITDNSAEVKSGFLFLAIKGNDVDGHDFIEEAVRSGASVVIGEKDYTDISVPYIQIKNSRKVLGDISNIFYRDPSSKKIMIGITGTNGKTTTSYMLKYILEENGIPCSIIGTIENIINGKSVSSLNTTPNSLELHKLISSSKDEVIIIEVSSHGLIQYRLEGLQFDYCLFTNLDHDHLDFHGSIEEYFRAKSLLFGKMKPDGQAIINADDYWGEKLGELLKSQGKDTFLIGKSDQCSLKISEYHNMKFNLKENGESFKVHLPMPGFHNLFNTAMAYSTARMLNVSREHVLKALSKFPGVTGRFEVIEQINGSTVVIDYAHTADAIFHCLKTARDCGAKRIIHIFGFRGDRDASKREEMANISSELSDLFILTTDDLNSVSYDDMAMSLQELNEKYNNNGIVIPDRTLAIKQALEMAKKGDYIVITGKGHEQFQQPFSLPTHSDKDTISFINEQRNQKDI
ncbi:UDP-N-acetylmuramoyl-L-alanyl-D-glutamate--2,6-diaminopimelate ligase [Peribacillus cavernae]|uniref:UDP-N-acetylmuramyl-tripeptide synthetase n=1 Tax=Peribacillus cavernae TaxID=1674310 RepID=A0A3S0UHY3_9BACI|nr:UDP-N-acetylmuramoyl-L-alanyl-D-glutamate--2,6-diaminopimelate ligase [Peribacillus cavernae]MDQ0219982.1 UDP-N-acetylmuramoyl-L-alanyl-D-glutamate--2,6-diaminopimelate ligase [Peribacillus cavernae]RUQ32047.1 UDP-N-acetylmuramoyl-L-alanyl-D-glutamate--2,6-diaminopimelate ligase [Peribacillus cavernae]